MKKQFKVIVYIVISIAIVLVIAGVATWKLMGKPMYIPGMVRAGENLRAPLKPPTQKNDRQFWIVEEDIQLYHFSKGSGRNVLVVHGGPGNPYRHPWEGLASLTSRFKFHYYDQRGCGKSNRPFDTFTSSNYYANMKTLDAVLGLGAQIADIERIRQILGEEHIILIGHSFGGFLASLYAAEFPERIEKMILISPAEVLVLPQEEGAGLFEEIKKRLPENLLEEYDACLKRYLDFRNIFSYSEADLVALNNEIGRYYQIAIGTKIPEQGEAGGWMVFAMYLSMGRRHDYRAALKMISAPVLVIHGADDLQTEDASRLYAETFSNAEFKVIERAKHFAFHEQPEVFSQFVSSFLLERK